VEPRLQKLIHLLSQQGVWEHSFPTKDRMEKWVRIIFMDNSHDYIYVYIFVDLCIYYLNIIHKYL
jgi:hypothetical protein